MVAIPKLCLLVLSHTLIELGKSISIGIDLVHLTSIEDRLLKGIFIGVRVEEGRVGVGVLTARSQERSWQSHALESAKVEITEPSVIKDLHVTILAQSSTSISVEQQPD